MDLARLIPTTSNFAALTLTEAEKKHKDLIASEKGLIASEIAAEIFAVFNTETQPKGSVARNIHFNAS
ncbi:MAG: hypothetical protein ACI9E4_000701 [Pseudohongiellaceae bacterium]